MEVEVFKNILKLISEEGLSLRKALKEVHVGSETFYKFIDSDLEYQKLYARACEYRHDLLFDDILDIADESVNDRKRNKDGELIPDNEAIQRSKLRVDARKWALAKMNPKKYGDKIDITTDGKKISTTVIDWTNDNIKTDPEATGSQDISGQE